MTTATQDIRNIALIGHGTSGKTILTDALLLTAGEDNRIGSIQDGTTLSDYHEDEIKRQISISMSLMHCTWKGKKINIIDTPGFLDFIGDLECALHVADLAVMVINAKSGVEAGTHTAWTIAEENKLPRFVVVNMLNKENVRFDNVLHQIKEALSPRVVPFQLPINAGLDFCEIADVLLKKKLVYKTNGSGKYTQEELPSEWKDKVEQMHQELLENVAESDDALLEKFFEAGTLTEEELMTIV